MKKIYFYPDDIKTVKVFWKMLTDLKYELTFNAEKTRYEFETDDVEKANLLVNFITNAISTKAINGTITTEEN